MRVVSLILILLVSVLAPLLPCCAAESPSRVTIIYDAFGKPSSLERGWGYSALVEHDGKRILYDTGGQYDTFARNAVKLKVDLKKLDFVVISHRHGDHVAGLAYVLKVNPNVKVYAPHEGGSFGGLASGPVQKMVKRKVDDVPPDMKYFDGEKTDEVRYDSPWHNAHFTLIDDTTEVSPGIFLFTTVSDRKGSLELHELTMAIKTSKGLAVFAGCSHPGIEKILTVASKIDPKIYTVFGGLHFADYSDQDVSRTVDDLKNKWNIERIAVGHCTGEFGQAELEKAYGDHHDHAGVGETINLPN